MLVESQFNAILNIAKMCILAIEKLLAMESESCFKLIVRDCCLHSVIVAKLLKSSFLISNTKLNITAVVNFACTVRICSIILNTSDLKEKYLDSVGLVQTALKEHSD